MGDRFEERKAAILKVLRAKELSKADNVPCQIDKGLYLGSLGAANMRNTLKSLNVTHILSITSSLAQSYPDEFVYKTVLVPDRSDANISQYFNECFTFIDEARTKGGGVLVHCFAGKSRSVTVVVAYLMFKNGTSLSEAMGYVNLKRPVASPNPGFMIQLQEYERSLRALAVETFKSGLDPDILDDYLLDRPESTGGDLEVDEFPELVQTHLDVPEAAAVKQYANRPLTSHE